MVVLWERFAFTDNTHLSEPLTHEKETARSSPLQDFAKHFETSGHKRWPMALKDAY
jgi:hypothetical protein